MKFVSYSKRNIKYYIKLVFLETKGISLVHLADLIADYFKQNYISDNDIKLFNLVFKKDATQQDFDNFIKEWDIEVEGGHKALLLSYFMKTHPEIKYPEYVQPRLSGLLQFYRFRNLKLMAHFKRVCSKLIDAGIDILIIKGGSILHMRPDMPRLMGDIDILVHKEDYEKCKDIVSNLGYSYQEFIHSIDLHEGDSTVGILDIHHILDMDGGGGKKFLLMMSCLTELTSKMYLMLKIFMSPV